MLYVIEGKTQVGKTTYINELKKNSKTKIVELKIAPNLQTLERAKGLPEVRAIEYMRAREELINKTDWLEKDENGLPVDFVIDRWHPSTVVNEREKISELEIINPWVVKKGRYLDSLLVVKIKPVLVTSGLTIGDDDLMKDITFQNSLSKAAGDITYLRACLLFYNSVELVTNNITVKE